MRRNVLMWALLPVVVALGATVGYVAAGTGTAHDSAAPAAHQQTASAPIPVTTSAAEHTHDAHGANDAGMSGMPQPAASSGPVAGSHAHDAHGANEPGMAAMPQPAASSSPAAAGHADDTHGGSDHETAAAGPAAAEQHSGGHGSTGAGVSATVRTTVVITFVAVNAAILLAAAVVRRRTRRTPTTRRPAAQAA
ncbi:hypothetical protein [Actinoplanes sp. NPDC049802]|uniref:hypothetical protein n=1 Tax=Actinoplanes sp. NPDC049802 TaxID=3154742 RepID=UPI0033E304CF